MPTFKSFLFTIFFVVTCVVSVFTEEETFTITTYYPSPYGSYNELSTNRLAVGYTESSEQPTRDGDIRLRPQLGDPDSWEAGKPGQISYSASKDALYYYSSFGWKAQGGGGCYVSYSGSCRAEFTNMGSPGLWGVCVCSDDDREILVASYFVPPGGPCVWSRSVCTRWEKIDNLSPVSVCCQN